MKMITSNNRTSKKILPIAILVVVLILIIATIYLYFNLPEAETESALREVSQLNLQKDEVFNYVINQDGTVDQNRVAITFVSTGNIKKRELRNEDLGGTVGEIYVLEASSYDRMGNPSNINVVVQAVHLDSGENIYQSTLRAIVEAERLNLSASEPLSIDELRQIFSRNSVWQLETSLSSFESLSDEADIYLEFIEALGSDSYYTRIKTYVDSGLTTDLNEPILPESIYPYRTLESGGQQ